MQQHEIINVQPRRQKTMEFWSDIQLSNLLPPPPTPPHLDMVPILAPLFLPTNQNRNPPPFSSSTPSPTHSLLLYREPWFEY